MANFSNKIWIQATYPCIKDYVISKYTFRLGGQIEFGIIYIHTQLNTTVYVGITKKRQKNNLPKPAADAPSYSPPNIPAVDFLS